MISLATQLATVKKALSEGQAARSAANRSLAEDKAARQTVEQSLQGSNDAKANLARDLESAQASLTATTDKLATKSHAQDQVVIRGQKMGIQLKAVKEKLEAVEDKLKATEEKMKTQGQSLDLA
jgi:chromosome segregation ATPase